MPGEAVSRLRKALVSLCIPSVCKMHTPHPSPITAKKPRMTSNSNDLPGYTLRKMNLHDLKLDTDLFQPRERGLDKGQVDALVSALRRGCTFPPVDVWVCPQGGYFLVHGHHRYEAYKQVGRRRTIEAHVYTCSLAEARLVSIAENSHDRLNLSTTERSQYAWRLYCAHGDAYTQTQLARVSGICRRTVGNMREVHEKLVGDGANVPDTWLEALAALSTRVWEYSDEEREAMFRERRTKLRERVDGPIRGEARRDPCMVFDVLVEAMGEAAFARAAAKRGYHRGDIDQFTGDFSPYVYETQSPALSLDAAF